MTIKTRHFRKYKKIPYIYSHLRIERMYVESTPVPVFAPLIKVMDPPAIEAGRGHNIDMGMGAVSHTEESILCA